MSLRARISSGVKTGLVVLALCAFVAFLISWFFLYPAYQDGAQKEGRASAMGFLGSMRHAVSSYHEDNGRYPDDLVALTIGGTYWGGRLPLGVQQYPYHQPPSRGVQLMTTQDLLEEKFSDSGGWAYIVSGSSAGLVLINCTHTDVRGTVWTSY